MSIKYDNTKLIREKTGLNYSDSYNLLQVHGYNLDDTLNSIEYLRKYILQEIEIDEVINEKLIRSGVYGKLKNKLNGIEEQPRKREYIFLERNLDEKITTNNKKKEKKLVKNVGAIATTAAVVAGATIGSGVVIYKLLTNKSRKAREISDKTNLSREESMELLNKHNGNVESALNDFNTRAKPTLATALSKTKIKENIGKCKEYTELGKSLSEYNTMRGGKKGFKGYVFEELHATDATINGQVTKVISNNGIADFKIMSNSGKVIDGQAKIGYRTKSINWDNYKNQTIIVDKGNNQLLNRAKKAGLDVVESNVSEKQAKSLASKMQIESKITGRKNAVLVPRMYSTKQVIKQCHKSGISSAKSGSTFGGGYSIGTNIVDVIDGEKTVLEAAADVTKDTAIAAGTAYIAGAATTAIASTSIGTSAIGVASAATSAITSTAIGASVIGAVGATSAVVSSAPAIVTGVGIGIGCSVSKKILDKNGNENE